MVVGERDYHGFGHTRFSSARVATTGARQLPASHWVSRVVTTLSVRAELKQSPPVYVMPGPVANAMAVGTGDAGAVGVTEGALQTLRDDELAGVLAHEIAHLAHGDTRLMAVVASTSRITAILSFFMQILILVSIPLILTRAMTVSLLHLLVIIVAPRLRFCCSRLYHARAEFAADRRAPDSLDRAGG